MRLLPNSLKLSSSKTHAENSVPLQMKMSLSKENAGNLIGSQYHMTSKQNLHSL